MERDYWQPSIFWGMSTRCFDTMWIVNIFFWGWGGSSPNMSDFIWSHVLTNVYQVLILCELRASSFLGELHGTFASSFGLILWENGHQLLWSLHFEFIFWDLHGTCLISIRSNILRKACQTLLWDFMKLHETFPIVVMVVGLSFFMWGRRAILWQFRL